jgi:hypothetical protein
VNKLIDTLANIAVSLVSFMLAAAFLFGSATLTVFFVYPATAIDHSHTLWRMPFLWGAIYLFGKGTIFMYRSLSFTFSTRQNKTL